MQKNELAELILTKFCHDIAGVAGATQNGTELLAETVGDTDFQTEALAALAESAKSLVARLSFFRMAFGPYKDGFDERQAESLIQNYIASLNHIKVEIEPQENADFALARIKMILALVAAETLTRGGKVAIFQDKVVAEGVNAFLSDKVREGLVGDESDPVSSEKAVGLFLCFFAEEKDYKITIKEKNGEISFFVK